MSIPSCAETAVAHFAWVRSRVQSRIDLNGPIHPVLGTRCHLWTGSKSKDGYGLLYIQRRNIRVTRLVWVISNGEISPGLLVMHRCDNPPCVRLDHLRLGTPAENAADMVEKGRAATADRHGTHLHPETMNPRRGEECSFARLTDDIVVKIRSEYGAGVVTQRELAVRYGAGQSRISQALTGETWAHLPGAVESGRSIRARRDKQRVSRGESVRARGKAGT